MQGMDLNLLPIARELLTLESVSEAADRLHLSVSATSRALDRCRRAFGDDLLVRDGRGLVITPRGVALREALDALLPEIDRLVAEPAFDPASLRRRFTISANEVIVCAVGPNLVDFASERAPGVEICFVAETVDDASLLASGAIDVAIGSYSGELPGIERRHLATEQLTGIARRGVVSADGISLEDFAAMAHVVVSRRGIRHGPVDDALDAAGMERRIVAVVPTFAAALAITTAADGAVTTLVPRTMIGPFVPTERMQTYDPPVPLPLVHVELLWHPRTSADPGNRWLRSLIEEIAGAVDSDHPAR